MENIKVYIEKFKIALAILVAGLAVAGFLISKVVPEFQKISKIQNDYKTKTTSLADSERKLKNIKAQAARKKAETSGVAQMFFKPVTKGLDTEAAISDEFGEILQIMRNNKIKMRSIKYDYDPQDDVFVKNAPRNYHVCKITAQMIATYANFASFLRELYKHEHFLDISSLEIVPYEKNKRILLVNLQLKLYAERDGSSPMPVQTAEDSKNVPSPQPVAQSPEEEEPN